MAFGVAVTAGVFRHRGGGADVDLLGGVACGVDTLLIEHGREIAPAIRAKAWRRVASPREAFELVLQSV